MNEETEIPECCKKYDELSSQINEIENEIIELSEELEISTNTIKEYIQILKDGVEVEVDLSYYKNKINKINKYLLENDEEKTKKYNELARLKYELNCMKIEVDNAGYVKVFERNGILQRDTIKWITKEKYEPIKNSMWYDRLV